MAFLQIQFKSSSLDMNVSANVLYPENVDKKKNIRVLYLLHGYTGHYMDWMRLTSIERYASKYQICVVMPSAFNSYYTNNAYGVKYFDFVALELPKMIENMFQVSKKSEDRFVAGLSMGGYGALKIGLTYPHKYHKMASFSGAIDVDRLFEANKDNLKRKQFLSAFKKMPVKGTKNDIYFLFDRAIKKNTVPGLYIACGTEDSFYEDHLKLKNYLDTNQIPYVNNEKKGQHEWRLWDVFIEDVLSWMFE